LEKRFDWHSLDWRSIDEFLIGNRDRLRAAANILRILTSRGVRVKRMDTTICKYAALDEIKAEEYRYWQSRPGHERFDAVSELTQAMYAGPDVPRFPRTLVRFECVQR
jgi:hypothetical protein